MKKFNIYLVNLDPTIGSEISKTRPCIVVSPDEMNSSLSTVVVVPLTSTPPRTLPTRILIKPSSLNKLRNESYAVLDQLKTIDKRRIIEDWGEISESEKLDITDTLLEMFSY
ncbi:MAG: type II toxin-antitoxin system PemK/MazF family toxin [Muribaculaceae bacterium]|nr:type II toxin-antitoxin system PemK/MazF family toxin [Muribaculaceae bacterium]